MENDYLRKDWKSCFQSAKDWTEALNKLHEYGFSAADLAALAEKGLPFGQLFVLTIELLLEGEINPGEEKQGVLAYLDTIGILNIL